MKIKNTKSKQLKLFDFSSSGAFGGELLLNKRKSRRPLDVKRPIHLVLRADVKSIKTFLRYTKTIEEVLQKFAHKFGVKIHQKAIVSNHMHFVIKIEHRLNYFNFVRAVSGVLAQRLKIKWEVRPFTRIMHWGRDFKRGIQYVITNELEALGLISYQPRKRVLRL